MTTFQLSSAQARALKPNSHVWVDASAGTGKTHVLSARVLRLMVEGAHPGSILCVTYTKAAAGEMTNRILAQLGRWATMDAVDLTGELATLLGGRSRVSEDITARARRLFLDVLDLPMGLNVQTLHAFSQSLLGRFPIEARTAPGFETLDERTTEELMATSRDRVLADAADGADEAAADASQRLARAIADQNFNKTLRDLRQMAPLLNALPSDTDALAQLVHDTLGVSPGQTPHQLRQAACQDSAFDGDGLRAVCAAIAAHGTDTEKSKAGRIISDWLAQAGDARLTHLERYQSVFLTSNKHIQKKLLTNAPAKAVPDALDIMTREAERLKALWETCALMDVAALSCAAIQFGKQVTGQYEAAKNNAAKLDYDDLIERTRSLLETADIPTWVMYKLDTQIRHVLVDEAQDNSAAQWRIIEQLTQEFFAAEAQDRSLFAVGDMKQSIYGFQGARPELFEASRSETKRKAGHVRHAFSDVPLNQSFRSVSAILNVVDTVFTGADMTAAIDAARVPIKHQSYRTGAGGMVDLWPVTLAEARSTEETGWHIPLAERRAEKADQILAQKIAADIAARLDARAHLPSRAEPLSPGDFLILVRRRNDFMVHMVRALKRRGIPVAGVDRFDLQSPLVVRDLINLARFVCLPQDDFTLACVLKSPFCNVSEETLMHLCTDRKAHLWTHIQRSEAVPASVLQTLKAALNRADFMPPFEFFSAALEHGGRRALLARLGVEASDALDVFLEQCLVYERSHAPSLDGFLRWFASSDEDVKRDAEAAGNKVRIMTVHGAKGLQAPVVYLPDLIGVPRFDERFLMLDHIDQRGKRRTIPILRRGKQSDIKALGEAAQAKRRAIAQEYARLLYVAMTRAEDHLICCGYGPAKPGDAYSMVEQALSALDPVTTLADGTLRYQIAQTVAVMPALATAKKAQRFEKPSWIDQPPPAEETPPKPLQPSTSTLTAPKLFDSTVQAEISPATRGVLVHKLLEHLPKIDRSERRAAASTFLRRSLPDASDEALEILHQQALDTLELPQLAPLFEPDSRAEVPLVAKLGDYVVSGVIDRLSMTPKDVMFIDYKTAALPPQAIDDIAPAYVRQMALYHASLKQMFPGRGIQGALVWTAAGRVDWLTTALLAAHLPPGVNSAFL
ncbi:MAG: double-strand break repair helicase AddA [Pseudomonadota bacterium]